jgi:mycofactocin precursor
MNRGRGPYQGGTYDAAGGNRRATGPGHADRGRTGRDRAADEAVDADELLVEEVSVDGMCGVY